MTASMMKRIDDAQFALVKMSTRNLIDDRRPLTPPLRAFTAKLADVFRKKALTPNMAEAN